MFGNTPFNYAQMSFAYTHTHNIEYGNELNLKKTDLITFRLNDFSSDFIKRLWRFGTLSKLITVNGLRPILKVAGYFLRHSTDDLISPR